MSKCHGTNCPGHFGRIGLPHAVINPLFVGLLTVVLQTVCMNCQRLRISPYYLQAAFPMKSRSLHRLKAIGALCSRQTFCQFCQAMVLSFKQQGISIMARPTLLDGAALVMVPANIIFSVLVRLPDIDIAALGFGSHNHPCNTILSTVLVLPPVSRPAMRTVNLKTGNPFVPNRLHSAPAGGGGHAAVCIQWRTASRPSTWASFRRSMHCKMPVIAINCGQNTWNCTPITFFCMCAYTKVCGQHRTHHIGSEQGVRRAQRIHLQHAPGGCRWTPNQSDDTRGEHAQSMGRKEWTYSTRRHGKTGEFLHTECGHV